MTAPARSGALAILTILLVGGVAAAGAWQGRPLSEYIAALNEQGLRIVFSTGLVRDWYRVREEPDEADPIAALRTALAPYGLTLAEGPSGSLLVTRLDAAAGSLQVTVRDAGGDAVSGATVLVDGAAVGVTDSGGRLRFAAASSGVYAVGVRHDGYRDAGPTEATVAPGERSTMSFTLTTLTESLAEVIVTSSRYRLRYEQPGSHTFLERELTTKLPHIGDEAVRSIQRLPGTTGGGVSTRHHVRGGLLNEQLFRLDGLRLYEPYHMKDFHSVATIVDQSLIAGIDFYSAGYPARYGDRMSGVVDISLREPSKALQTELGLSLFNASALSMGRFGDAQRGYWMASFRRGNLDLIADIVNPDFGAPRYEDALLGAGWEWSPRTTVSANLLFSYDKIAIAARDGNERGNAQDRNGILWFKAETDWTDAWSGTTILSATDIDTRRLGSKDAPGVLAGSVDDNRQFRSLALKQDWAFIVSDAWSVSGGFDLKELDADYRYRSSRAISPPFDRIFGNEALTERSIDASPSGSQYAVYLETRWRLLESLVVDLGLRWDQQTYTTADDDEQISPRVNVLYRLGKRSDLRLGLGQFYQAQEINELQVSDGLDRFFAAQRARHLVLSLDHRFQSGIDLRLEWYEKRYRSLMPRFENVFDPLVLIPELQIDRVRIDADTAIARGAELMLGGERRDFLWWASYGWSETKDEFPDCKVRRGWDQAHTVKGGMNWDWHQWSFSMAGGVHTGWPKTALTGETENNPDGSVSLSVTTMPRSSQRYSVYHTVDARVSRDFDVPKGRLSGFIEISNLYNRGNPCCTEYSVTTDADGAPRLESKEGIWLPLIPSLGVMWRF